ncbi:MAG TPA: chaperone modulator CbpM [Bryobacteraceae bacterium]|jgi:hypothetical protein|nr:chaperone modulator CbpM [Bryobacteraceae bacterium]
MTVRQYQLISRSVGEQRLTLDDLALHADMHPALVERLVELRLIRPVQQEGAMFFDASAISRLRSIGRLRRGLGINLAGVSVVLDLIDKVWALQRENETLKKRL